LQQYKRYDLVKLLIPRSYPGTTSLFWWAAAEHLFRIGADVRLLDTVAPLCKNPVGVDCGDRLHWAQQTITAGGLITDRTVWDILGFSLRQCETVKYRLLRCLKKPALVRMAARYGWLETLDEDFLMWATARLPAPSLRLVLRYARHIKPTPHGTRWHRGAKPRKSAAFFNQYVLRDYRLGNL
jgi:hypothetical protein